VSSVDDILEYGPRGGLTSNVGAALAYSAVLGALTTRRYYDERHLKQAQDQLRFYDKTGFPNFPLGEIHDLSCLYFDMYNFVTDEKQFNV
jgi:hypothetical protein